MIFPRKAWRAKQITPPSLIQTLLNIVPMNPIDALAKGNMLQVIFFAVIFGFALSSLGETANRCSVFLNSSAT